MTPAARTCSGTCGSSTPAALLAATDDDAANLAIGAARPGHAARPAHHRPAVRPGPGRRAWRRRSAASSRAASMRSRHPRSRRPRWVARCSPPSPWARPGCSSWPACPSRKALLRTARWSRSRRVRPRRWSSAVAVSWPSSTATRCAGSPVPSERIRAGQELLIVATRRGLATTVRRGRPGHDDGGQVQRSAPTGRRLPTLADLRDAVRACGRGCSLARDDCHRHDTAAPSTARGVSRPCGPPGNATGRRPATACARPCRAPCAAAGRGWRGAR